ncbi:MAG: hypothetical protein LBG65_03210 [Puniceicoccales bacterium]|jgi:hypothetical protein|nr:hypothetical protein [Puniceicoccales bacterium]
MGKNKNKQKSWHQTPAPSPKPASKEVVMQAVEQTTPKIDEFRTTLDAERELSGLSKVNHAGDSPLPPDDTRVSDASKIKDENELSACWEKVEELRISLEGLLASERELRTKNETITKELQEKRDRLEIEKKEVEKERGVLQSKIKDADARHKEFMEKAFRLDAGEYTGVVRKLFDTISETERGITENTEKLLKDVGKIHRENMGELSEIHQKNMGEFAKILQENMGELAGQLKDFSGLRREQRKLEADRTIFQEELGEFEKEKAEFGGDWRTRLQSTTSELERWMERHERLKAENEKVMALLARLKAAFGIQEDEIEGAQFKSLFDLREENDAFREELDDRPTWEMIENKEQQIKELKAKIEELRKDSGEKELLELRRLLDDEGTFAIEISGLKGQVESAKVREKSLKKINGELQKTIECLKGESDKKVEAAFEFAKDADEKASFQENPLKDVKPRGKFELIDLIPYVRDRIAGEGFYYDDRTLRTFLSGLHMSPISILQGISGTGKTSLPREFAKALLAHEEYKNDPPCRICAIQSGWRDNMDLMGHYNSFEKRYKETEFFKALYLANLPKFKDTLFFIILDEMNLSRPEYYFADFLSLLEQSEHYIPLSDVPMAAWPKLVKDGEGRLSIPENVRFIGTANHDETTLEFAPKTYDRSNVMEMPRNHPRQSRGKDCKPLDISYGWLKKKFEESEEEHSSDAKKFQDFLKDNEDRLAEKGIGIGNRFEKQAERFISVFRASGGLLAEAADHLITSRILRTLRNRYDLDEKNLQEFRDDFDKRFRSHFGDIKEPHCIGFLDREIKRKQGQ